MSRHALPDPEVLVVGGGPAGSTVAGILAGGGRDVLVVDRADFPRPKPCGECLNPGAVAALDRLGLLETVLALDPARLQGWRVEGTRSSVQDDFGAGLGGLALPRERLDHALLQEALARGARLREGVRAEEVEPATGSAGPRVRLRLAGGDHATLRPRLVVGADGLRSRVARSLGLVEAPSGSRRASLTCRVRWPSGAPEDGGPGPGAGGPGAGGPGRRGSLQVYAGITLGVAPVDGVASLGNVTVVAETDRHGSRMAADPRAFVAAVLQERLPPPWPEIVAGPWASGPFRRRVRRPWAPGVVLVGDAAGYYDPFTGQGIYRALRSAELAAEAVEAALDRGEAGWAELARYGRRWRAEVAPGRRLQRVVHAVMTRAWLREPVLGLLDRARLLPPIIRVTGDAAPVSSLFHPTGWARAPE